jgi:CO/xanthine dehydrogenase Mo-binding subunit
MGAKYFGASVRRKEDPRYLRGDGRFVDDIKLPGMLHVAFVRSPHAHARIAAIRTDAARRLPGVAHVFTFADLERWMKPLPLFGAIPPGLAARVAVTMKQPHQLAMCRDEARHVGEIVAMVLAGSRAVAEDGAELVEVDYEPLPPRHVEAAAAGRRAHPPGATTSRLIPDRLATPRRPRQADARPSASDPALRRHADRDARRGAWWDPRTDPQRGTARRSSTLSAGLVAALGLPPTRSGSSPPTWAAASAPRPTATRRTC